MLQLFRPVVDRGKELQVHSVTRALFSSQVIKHSTVALLPP